MMSDHNTPTETTIARVFAPENARFLALVGAALLAVSPFLSWYKVVLVGGVDLFASWPVLAWLMLIVGIVGVIVGFAKASKLRELGALMLFLGIMGGMISGLAFLLVINDVSNYSPLAQLGFGWSLAIIGATAMIVNGIRITRLDKALSLRGEQLALWNVDDPENKVEHTSTEDRL